MWFAETHMLTFRHIPKHLIILVVTFIITFCYCKSGVKHLVKSHGEDADCNQVNAIRLPWPLKT